MTLELRLRHEAPALDLALSLPAGRISALVGPSGSGKTSLLRAVAGLLRVREAEVGLEGQTWSDSRRGLHLPTRSRPLGLVPQNYGLFPHLTALGNVEMALTGLAPAERAGRARACLELTRVGSLERRYPHELSGGQRQRVALARALARQPRLLLLDEPFSAVDRGTRKELYAELLALQERLGTTVVLVTHDLDEAAQLAGYLCLLQEGRLLQDGPLGEVMSRPRSEAAARLLDIPNVFAARPEEGGAVLRWGPHRLALEPAPQVPVEQFAVLPQNVLLVRPDKPPGEHLDNPVPARVERVRELGGEAELWLAPAGLPGERLTMRLPLRAVQRYGLGPGVEVTVCVRRRDIVPLGPSPAERVLSPTPS